MVATEPTLMYTLLSLVVKTQLGPQLKKSCRQWLLKLWWKKTFWNSFFSQNLKQINLIENARSNFLLLKILKIPKVPTSASSVGQTFASGCFFWQIITKMANTQRQIGKIIKHGDSTRSTLFDKLHITHYYSTHLHSQTTPPHPHPHTHTHTTTHTHIDTHTHTHTHNHTHPHFCTPFCTRLALR